MSSRQEEKARRKAEREELERQQAAKAASAKRLQIVGGVVLVLAAVAAIVVVATSGGGGHSAGPAASSKTAANAVALPAPKQTDLKKAAAAAGCVLLNPPSEGRTHTTSPVTYKNSNPPASGPHNPVWAQDGIYTPANSPTKEHWVHALEHGRVLIQYRPGTAKHVRDQLETVGSEKFHGSAGYHVLVFQNDTNMPYAVAAVAWTHVLGCKKMNDGVFDAIRDFRAAYTDKAPELIP